LINGKPLKAINQFYNKTKAKLQAQLKGKAQTSKRIQRLTNKRNNQVDNYLHQASRWIINYLDKRGISKLIVGKNPLWKQSINIGKKNNQTFLSIPHCKFIDMLIYKGKLKGIEVICVEESYTSLASFLDLDVIPTYTKNDKTKYSFSGKRISRGLYKSKSGKKISSDVNGSYNILRKVISTAFGQGIEGVVVRPISVIPNKTTKYSQIFY
jgi:putative transposase